MTRGDRGAVAATELERIAVDPIPTILVDTTGAGDAFLAGLLVGLVAGEGTEAALRTAASYGSRAVESVGAWPAFG